MCHSWDLYGYVYYLFSDNYFYFFFLVLSVFEELVYKSRCILFKILSGVVGALWYFSCETLEVRNIVDYGSFSLCATETTNYVYFI